MPVDTETLLEVYRPRSFKDFLGQNALVATLRERIRRGGREVERHFDLGRSRWRWKNDGCADVCTSDFVRSANGRCVAVSSLR